METFDTSEHGGVKYVEDVYSNDTGERFENADSIVSPKREDNDLGDILRIPEELKSVSDPLKTVSNKTRSGEFATTSLFKHVFSEQEYQTPDSVSVYIKQEIDQECKFEASSENCIYPNIDVIKNEEPKKNPSTLSVILPTEDVFICRVCSQSYNNKTDLVAHNIFAHRKNRVEEKPFECDICNKCFTHSSQLRRHRKTHTGAKPFECDICKKTFTSKCNLSTHQRIHTENKAFECDICKKRFTSSSDLSRHQRTHTGVKPFGCDICKKRFTTSYDLSRHQRTHTGEKPFECEICKKKFTRSSNLSAHKRTHTEEKNFECDICKERFNCSLRFSRHQRSHRGEKPYECCVCKKCFTFSSGLSRHQRTHTNEKPFECNKYV
ncbi:zinc finger protein 664-like isoform X2 [Artemia franciscana]|uniref:zinc finger protein 664-like isoform X2 n=1 Tax=Artemia franciscana TaxID=6661 RepID=UPI0032D9D858